MEFTALHAEYRELFECRASEFCEQEGLDLQELLDKVAISLREDPGDTRALIDSLTASEDYLAFCKFMQRVRQRRDWAEGREVVPVEDDDIGTMPKRPQRGLEQVPEEEEADPMD